MQKMVRVGHPLLREHWAG